MDMTLPTVPDTGIKDTDRQLIRTLARSLSAEQALWVSGYFAGAAEARGELMALGNEASTVISRARDGQAPASTLKFLFAGETGNAAGLARDLVGRAERIGIKATAEDLARYKVRGLKDEETVLFIASTHGEGDPPETAASFFEFLASRKAPSLEGLRFAVLALGDSTYEFFCEAGKLLDRRLAALGASRLADRCDCDVDYEGDANAWAEHVLGRLQDDPAAGATSAAHLGTPDARGTSSAHGTSAASGAVSFALAAAKPAVGEYGKHRPFAAPIMENLRITGRGSSKATRHLELALDGSGLGYLPGDALGIVPSNDPALVGELIGELGWAGSEKVAGRGGELQVSQALTAEFEVTTLTPRFIGHWATLSGDKRLAELASNKTRAELAAFMAGNQIIDLVRASPAAGVSPQDFLQGLRTLQPRLYSIASSADFVPDEVHLCVAPVQYRLHERERQGVASRYLAERRNPGESVPVFVQRNDNFRLPDDPGAPIIMIGAGTGVAPYRAFMQHREALGIEGKSWLFFGERNFHTDFLYQAEWQEWHRSKALTHVDLAFSRDQQDKLYVQHRLHEQAVELFRWLEDGAHLYVCGDAESMAHDVQATLLAVVSGQRGRGSEDAQAYLRELQAVGRYQKDVY